MPGDTVIKVEGISKKFSRSLKHVMAYGVEDIARNLVGLLSRADQLRGGEFWAVNDVSFEVKRGKAVGIIGSNGSGKTTLLKLLNGIFMPDKGRIEIKGRVSALIEVGAGFHPMLSGRENIYINGAILGMSKKEIDNKFDEIVDFADIGDFIDMPVKHYSSGMYVRLGFAVAAHIEPDILIMDEILAVGDAAFQKKCFATLRKYIDNGGTLLFVSHDLSVTVSVCDETLLFSGGELKLKGPSNSVINVYKGIMSGDGKWPVDFQTNTAASNRYHRFGVGGAKIQDLVSLDERGRETKTFFTGQKLKVRFSVRFDKDVENPIYGLTIKDRHGLDIYMTDTFRLQKVFTRVTEGTKVLVEMEFKLPLITNTYFITAVISELGINGPICLDGIFDAIDFFVVQENNSLGIVNFDPDVQVSKIG